MLIFQVFEEILFFNGIYVILVRIKKIFKKFEKKEKRQFN